ncbi:MAG: TIGR01777 family protein [Planctomycetes bacterium]|nr:TIGR01777 family protein [Planctomycetota bacterium]
MSSFSASHQFSCSRSALFHYHEAPGAIDRLIPPWESVSVVESADSLAPGSVVRISNRQFGIHQTWKAEHVEFVKDVLFVDQLRDGPFRQWVHRHEFSDVGADCSQLTDRIDFELPLAPVSNLALLWVRAKLQSMFRFRHRITSDDIAFGESIAASRDGSVAPFRIAVTGSTGLIGRRVCELASVLGFEVIRIVRPESLNVGVRFPTGVITAQLQEGTREDQHRLEGLDAVIHLGGYGIADRRWSSSVKQRIRDSRVAGTMQLIEGLGRLDAPPKAMVSASGIGIFGDRGEEICGETTPAGTGYLSDVAREWESAAMAYGNRTAGKSSRRVAIARMGVVLHPKFGALSKLLPPFRLGVGGRIGSGKQYWPWVHIDDAASILIHLAVQSACEGPFHVASPEVPTNSDFAKTLAKVLSRPACMPAPAFAMNMLLGEMAGPLLLASTRVITPRLLSSGYRFRFSSLDESLRNLLGL